MSPVCGILNRNGKDVSAQMRAMMSALGLSLVDTHLSRNFCPECYPLHIRLQCVVRDKKGGERSTLAPILIR
jgi:hypothetical protein